MIRKKRIVFLLAFLLFLSSVTGINIVSGAESGVMCGDIDNNSAINSIDFALLRKHLLGMDILAGDALKAADVNVDNSVNSIDIALLKMHLLGIKLLDIGKKFEKIEDALMTYSGLTIVSYGGYLNGESFQQEGIITYNGYQYTAFWNTNRHVVFARRALPSGEWKKFEFMDHTNTANDAHNTISLGICPKDGTIHLSFDHHGNDLHYRRSVIGLANDPEKYSWDAKSFGAVTSVLGNTKVTLVTYPRFITTPEGNMLFEYRYGTSGSGDQYLWEYSGTTQQWTSIGKYLDGISHSINAYAHGLSYGKDGKRLHMTWCWRETPDAATNHDLCYIYSDDNGRTWKNNAGNEVSRTGSTFVTKNSFGIKVWNINQNRGLINQEHSTVDSMGRVHVLLSHMPDGEADDSNFTNSRNKSKYFHYWRDTDGTWSRNEMGYSVVANFRGKLAVSASNTVYAILPNLRIACATAANNWTDWTLIDTSNQGRFFSDPLIDTNRLYIEDKLTVLCPVEKSPNIYALTYNLK